MADWHSLYNALSYTFGNCTQFVAGTFSWVGAHWGNGCQWADSAKAQGLTITKKPTAGAIAVYDCSLPGSDGNGHVAVVDKINSDGSFMLNEVNWNAFNTVDSRQEALTSSTGQHIIGFILPPGVTLDSASQPGVTTTGFNPFDPTQLANTITGIGKTIEQDLFRVALVVLGVFVIFLGIGLLLSSELRNTLDSSVGKVPGAHAASASKGLEVADNIA